VVKLNVMFVGVEKRTILDNCNVIIMQPSFSISDKTAFFLMVHLIEHRAKQDKSLQNPHQKRQKIISLDVSGKS